jgi:TRAP-type uncharacterized transport system substrate-binding protein
MKRNLIVSAILFGFILVLQAVFSSAYAAKKPVTVVVMTTPFGTPYFNIGAAFEQVFKKANSWVQIKHQETAGAMYMFRYVIKNRQKMIDGTVPHTVIVGGPGTLGHLTEGRPPFNKLPWPSSKMLVSTGGVMSVYGTYDPNIKTLKDFAGKRVCTMERARVFLGVFLEKPLFAKGVENFDKIKWAPLGSIGCKDAFLNGKVDVIRLGYAGVVNVVKDGTYMVPFMVPTGPTMEVLSAGRKIYQIGTDRDLVKRSYDFSKDMIVYPGLIKKGAFKNIKADIWGRAGFLGLQGDAGLPDDIVEEIVRVRHEHRKDFGKYHAQMKLFPMTPYPLGTPKKYIHPGVIKAMKKLGYPIPKID